jgi:subtilisin-like proprotein convertase family protein
MASRSSRGCRHIRTSFVLALATALSVGVTAGLTGPASAIRTPFANNAGVAIADANFSHNDAAIQVPDNSVASPYPSSINVVQPGIIEDLNVTLIYVSHTYADDLDLLLVGPGGQQVTLMSDAGGSTDVSAVFVGFDDESANVLPDDGAIGTLWYRPANYSGTDAFPSPAPEDTGNTSLGVFDGTNMLGTWRLFVVDDNAQDSGSIGAGWELHFRVRSAPYPSQINVSGLAPRVSDVNLTLSGLFHVHPDDLDVMLVGPGGQNAVVMSDVGSSGSLQGVNLALDDEALAALPDDGQITTGTYRPTDAVVPVDPDGFEPGPTPSGASALSVFDGSDPNGTWSLYVVDDSSTAQGTLAGWSLDIETDDIPPAGSIVINGGGAGTVSGAVSLGLSATDPGSPSSGVAEMRFSNDATTYSAFQPYATTAPWSLSGGDGTKTVYVQFRDGSGNVSTAVSDTITLDTMGPKVAKLRPSRGAKDVKPGAKVKITVTEALQAATVTKAHVFLKKKGAHGKVKAKLTYDAVRRTIVVKPKNPLHGTYTVTVKGVRDALGNLWDQKPSKAGAQALKYTFSTG